MSWAAVAKAPLVSHVVLETAACVSFGLQPDRQVPGASADHRAVLRSYSGLLLSTNLIAAYFAWRPAFDDTTQAVVASLAVYHIFPILRAWAKVQRRQEGAFGKGDKANVLGGPQLHVLVHGGCLAALIVGAIWGQEMYSYV